MIESILFHYKDIDGKDIHSGDTVLYDNETFIILYIGKDNIEWVLHPCGNTLNVNINIDDIINHARSSNINLKLISKCIN